LHFHIADLIFSSSRHCPTVSSESTGYYTTNVVRYHDIQSVGTAFGPSVIMPVIRYPSISTIYHQIPYFVFFIRTGPEALACTMKSVTPGRGARHLPPSDQQRLPSPASNFATFRHGKLPLQVKSPFDGQGNVDTERSRQRTGMPTTGQVKIFRDRNCRNRYLHWYSPVMLSNYHQRARCRYCFMLYHK